MWIWLSFGLVGWKVVWVNCEGGDVGYGVYENRLLCFSGCCEL